MSGVDRDLVAVARPRRERTDHRATRTALPRSSPGRCASIVRLSRVTAPNGPRARAALLFALVTALALALSYGRVAANIVYPYATLERVAGLEHVYEFEGITGPKRYDGLEGYCELLAPRPFVYRQLTPGFVRGVCELAGPRLDRMLVFHLIDVAAIVGAFYAMRRLARGLFGSERLALVCAFALLAALPFHFVLPRVYPFWYSYDMTTVCFVVVGLWLVRERRWGVFYPFFVMATLNRETTFVISLVYALTAWREDRWWRVMLHLAAQAALWFAMRYALLEAFPDVVNKKLVFFRPVSEQNLESLREPLNYLWLASSFAFAWIPALAFWRYIRVPWIKWALLVVPVYAALMFRAANWIELRVWGEVLPLVVLAAVAGIVGWRASRASRAAPS
jgi:hypothetical protein